MKTKRFLSLALVLAMVLGSFGLVAADTAVTTEANPYERIVESGIFVGDNGDLMLDETFTRAEYATVALRLKGEGFTDQETVALNIASSFTDVDAGRWYAPYIGRAQRESLVEGDLNKYLPENDVSYVESLTILMRTLGYLDDVDLVDYPTGYYAKAAEIGLADVAINAKTKITRRVIADTLEVALDLKLKGSDVTLAQKLGIEDVVVIPDTLEAEVEVNSAKSFKVIFNKAVEDTSKIEFSVKRGTATVSVTTEWNEDKTEAVLKVASTKLAEGIYTITVTDKSGEEAVELVKVDREIKKEEVVSVEFDSDIIVRINDEEGVVGYTVRNQYGENITDAPLGRGLDWIVSTNDGYDRDAKAGVLTVKHTGQVFNQLKDLKTVVVTVRDVSTGFVVTKSFGVSDTVAVVSDIKLLGIIDEKGNEVEFIFDQTKTYYLDFEAHDVNGKNIDYYAALNSRLYPDKDAAGNVIPNTGTRVLDVRSSNESLVTVKLEKHPDTGKAVYRIIFEDLNGPSYDTPVSFIAMAPFTGKTSTLNTTLLRKARVETFTLQSPYETASVGRSIEIPYVAVDGNGKDITRYVDLDGKVTFSPKNDVYFVRQGDGSAKLFAKFITKGTKYITATVDGSLTGSFSQISIDVKEASKSGTINALRHSAAYTYDKGEGSTWKRQLNHFDVKDQYDRALNLRSDSEATGLEVRVSSSNNNVIDVVPGDGAAKVGNNVVLKGRTDNSVTFKAGATHGTATITYVLWDNNTGKQIDSATTIVYNVEPKDVKGAKISLEHGRDLFVLEKSSVYGTKTTKTDLGERMRNELTVYGVLDSGMDVRLPSTMYTDFTSTNGKFVISGKNVHVNEIGNATTASTTVTGYVIGRDGVMSDSIQINANTAAPAPTAVIAKYENYFERVASIDNDVIEITAGDFVNYVVGKYLVDFDPATGGALDNAGVRFQVDTNYGMKNSGVVTSLVVKKVGANNVAIDYKTGLVTLTSGSIPNSGEITVTAIAANGMTKTIKFEIRDGGVVIPPEVDKEALVTITEEADALVEDDYTAESYAAVTDALAMPEEDQDEVDAKVAAIRVAIDELVIEVGEDEIAGKLEEDLFGKVLEFTVSNGADITEVTLNGDVLSEEAYDYGIDGNDVIVGEVKEGDVVTVTVAGKVYTVKF